MVAYSLECTICSGVFTTRASWLEHLLLPHHQDLARLQVQSIWTEIEEKEASLAVYSTVPVASMELLRFLNTRQEVLGEVVLVTGFAWSVARPQVGVVQFESRCAAELMFAHFHRGPEKLIEVGSFQVQFRKVSEFLLLEWLELFPLVVEPVQNSLQQPPQEPVTGSCSKVSSSPADLCGQLFTSLLQTPAARRHPVYLRNLIQAAVDGSVREEEFEVRLRGVVQFQYHSGLVPFLKESLPHLRHSLVAREIHIEGIFVPPLPIQSQEVRRPLNRIN